MKETIKTSKKEEMAKAGLHFGHKTSKRHPKMEPYIEGIKGEVHLINLTKTEEKMEECLAYLKKLKEEGKVVLFVSTKPEFKKIVRETANECGMPYVVSRFLGGTITNFNIIKKRIDYYNDLLKQKENNELEQKYTKQERVKIGKEMEGMEKKFEGLRNIKKVPDAVFVVDMIKDDLAVNEARKRGVTVIAIADTNADPDLADYFIPANDDSVSSVSYILKNVKEALTI